MTLYFYYQTERGVGNVVPFNNRFSSHDPGMVYIRENLEDTEEFFHVQQ